MRLTLLRARESRPPGLILLLRVESDGTTLGSYSGRLRFDTAAFVVDSVLAGRDGSRFVNGADASRGMIRFAGFSASGFVGIEAVRLVGHLVKPLDQVQFEAILEVAGDLEGNAFPKGGLLGTTSIEPER